MQLPRRASLLLLTTSSLLPAALVAQSKNPADYPYRIHIFNRTETNYYHARTVDEAKGDGRANLFANSDVHGVDFTFACPDKLKPTLGFETYPAKWKIPNKELTVLLPVFGKAGSFFTCDLHTDVKQIAYTSRNGQISEEPAAAFKAWMTKHGYDPEHGKNQPTNPDQKTPATAGAK